jgi:hypothetical protein
MISSLKSVDGSCGAYIDAACERQAIRPDARIALSADRRQKLQQFHRDEPFLK